jgi:uncharacterized protein (TIGR02996 family)
VLALLADVKENPDDLAPWLVLTDWLEENGDEADRARAEYCRLCFDKLGKKTYASDWEKGERRRELAREWKDVWLGPIASTPADDSYVWGWQFRQGLVAIRGTFSALFDLRHRGIDEERWAWVEDLEVFGLSPKQARSLPTCPLLLGPAIVRLQIAWDSRIGPAIVAALTKSPHLARVRQLHLSFRSSRSQEYHEKLFRPLRDRLGEALIVSINQ